MTIRNTDCAVKTVEVIAPNLKRRLSGVTATIASLVVRQSRLISIAATGPGLPLNVPHLPLWRIPFLSRRLRVWHARRNNDLLLGLLLKWLRISNLKVVFTSASPRPRTGWTRFLIRNCDEVVATNQVNADVMSRSCLIIPHGVDTETFSPVESTKSDEPLLIGCYGRIRPMKGTWEFVEAMCRILPEHPNWSAVVIGRVLPRDNAYFDGLVALVKGAGLADRIRFISEVPLQDMPAAYRKLSIYVAPSHLEGFGLTVAEALATGIPTIATRGVGAFDELIEEQKNGFLYSPGDVNELEEKVRVLMDNTGLRKEMGQSARSSAIEKMSLDIEAGELVQMYKRLLTE
ncbi:MAG: glycosyltransferase family 4 protein [Lentibacter algarum]|uniref:glycosyltransferase family 4 protein n=1 Tax=Lentibacter algarum TaxID=576131 RepID=UPI003B8B910E